MNHNDYSSALLAQIRNSVRDVNTIAAAETFEFFESCIPASAVKTFSRVTLTGCGDSYCAGIAAKPVFENAEAFTGTGMVPGTPTEALRNIDCSRYLNTYKGWEPLTLHNNVVCAVSISGAPKRPTEAVKRFQEAGAQSIAFTTNPNSELAKNAAFVVPMTLPPCDHAPNVTSYYSSLFSLMMFGFYMSMVKGQITREQANACRMGLLQYANSYSGKVMDELSEKAFKLAQQWEADGVDNMDFVGDGADYATAFFGSAKMVEAFGGLTTNDDSEDWSHINYFLKDTDHIGTFFVANTRSPSFDRLQDSIRVACELRKHVAVITDGEPELFPENAVVFRTPKAQAGWMSPLMQHIPMDFVAAYIACFRNTAAFRQDSPIHQRDAACARFRQSKIEVVK